MKIRTQFLVSMAVFVIVLVAISIALVSMVQQAERMEQRGMIADNLERAAYELNDLSNDYLRNGEERQRVQWETKFAQITALLVELDAADQEQQAVIRNIRANLQHLDNIFSDIARAERGRNTTATTAVDNAFWDTAWSRMAVQNQDLSFETSRLTQLIRNEAARVQQAYTFLIIALLGTIIAILLLNYFLIYRRFLRSVTDLRNGTDVIRSGDLTFRIPEAGDDEFRALAASFNTMTVARKSAEDELRRRLEELNATYEQLTAAEEELRQNYDEISRRELELRESEERYRVIFENRGVGILVVDTETHEHIIANSAVAAMLGYTVEELTRMSVMDIHPLAEREHVMEEFTAIVSGRKSMASAIPIQRKDGCIRFVDITASAIVIGQNRYFAGFFIDVTERMKAEAALKESEERLRLAQESAHAGTWEWDLTTNTNYWSENVFRLYGLDPATTGATYDTWLGSIHPQDREAASQNVQAAAERGDPIHTEWRVNLPGGSERWLMSRGQPVQDSSGRTVTYRGIVIDITENKNAEKEREALIRDLGQKNAEMERFLYTVSHELKTPLITIQGYAGLLEEDLGTGEREQLRENIRRILSAGEKMSGLLSDTLELSRIGRIVSPPEEVQFGRIVEEACTIIAIPIRQRGIRLEIEPDLPVIHADPVRMREVLVNLLENSVKYMGDQKDPRIHIGMEWRNGEPHFFVRDNGIGIKPRYLDRIFTLFEKLDASTPGSGIGLAVVKRIIEIHGGKIWAESEGEGKGTTIWFTLPADRCHPADRQARQPNHS